MSNSDILNHGKWRSKEGYIDITVVTDDHLRSIQSYWIRERKPAMESKSKELQQHIKHAKNKEQRLHLISKHNRRTQVIVLFNQIINNELNRRNIC